MFMVDRPGTPGPPKGASQGGQQLSQSVAPGRRKKKKEKKCPGRESKPQLDWGYKSLLEILHSGWQ